jgi:hypothetical protein
MPNKDHDKYLAVLVQSVSMIADLVLGPVLGPGAAERRLEILYLIN